MARIRIVDLPRDMELNEEDLDRVVGGRFTAGGSGGLGGRRIRVARGLAGREQWMANGTAGVRG